MSTATATNGLRKSRLYYANSEGRGFTHKFNCWGATKFVLGFEKRLRWVMTEEMTEWLEQHTEVVHETGIQVGDILSLWHDGTLEHTAVYLGRGKYFHKIGARNSEITNYEGVLAPYWITDVEYRRMLWTMNHSPEKS